MRRDPNAALAFALGLIVASAACSSGSGSDRAAPPTTTITTAAAATSPIEAGPYKVGHETIEVASRDGQRRRTVDVWYPADPTATGKKTRYSEAVLPSLYTVSVLAVEDVPVSNDAPFPLVVYSHGSGALRFIATFFTEKLASHGFVVVSADHTGDTALDVLAGHPASRDQEATFIASRVADVRLTIDSVLARSKRSGDRLHGAVDPDRIGITGHSWGGLTAFAAAGGVARPPGRAPIPRDDRLKVVVTMDATPSLLSTGDQAKIRVPVLQVRAAPSAADTTTYFAATKAEPFLQARLIKATHNEFTDICEWANETGKFPNAPEIIVDYIEGLARASCLPPNMAPKRVHDLTDWYAIAFLERYLAGDARYGQYLDAYPPGPHDDVRVDHPEGIAAATTLPPTATGTGGAPVP
jgi:dienelactone hydrolase